MPILSGTHLGPYEILGSLGAGGMGEVYRARDTRLERSVAIKILPAQFAGDPERRERFEREARAVAALSHPHVCGLFDIGMHAGSPYLVMEYLEGENLADRLGRGALPVGEAMQLAAQIADGLAAAHQSGIVHRDLKPANVKLTRDGKAKVLDFGLAKQTASEPTGTASPELQSFDSDRSPTMSAHMTAADIVMGTAGYMSPEQARGQPVDARTDVWALGVLLFEMLTGRRLFTGGSMADLLVSVLQQEIPFAELPAATPASVRTMLTRCLERDVNRRASSMRELEQTLRAAGVSASPAAPSTSQPSISSPSATAPTGTPSTPGMRAQRDRSILVLPFANLSPDPDNEYFSDGLTEEIIADLSKVDSLRVISRSTAMRFKGGDHHLRAIAEQLDVRHVLEGSVRKAGVNVRITAQLVDVDRDASVWSDKVTGTVEDVFEIQERVSRSIVDALRVQLSDSENLALRARPAVDPEVYDVYLRSRRDIWGFTRAGLDRAVSELQRVLGTAGDHPLLVARLGTAYWQYFNAGIDTDPAYLEKAEAQARKLRTLDPDGPYADSLLGLISASRGDIINWVRYQQRAAAVAPKDTEINVWLGLGLAVADFPERAKPVFDRIHAVDPMFDLIYMGYGSIDYFAGRTAQALRHYEKARELTHEHPGWVMVMAQAAASANDYVAVERIVSRWAMPPESHPLAPLPHMLLEATQGKRELLDRIVDDAYRAKLWPDLQYAYIMAQIYALVGDTDEAFRWLEQAVGQGWINETLIAQHDRALDGLRSDRRFDAVLERVRAKRAEFRAAVITG